MSAQDYNENWLEIHDEDFINRVKASFTDIDPLNQFGSYDYYKVYDAIDTIGTIDEKKFHYVVRIYAGKNGCGHWTSYFNDMKIIFDNLINKPECHFSKVWLIEWKNRCADDTSAALIGLRD